VPSGSTGKPNWLAAVPWHAFGAAFYLPLWFTAGNPDLFAIKDVVQPGLVLLGVIFVLALVLRLLFGDWRRAFLGASATMVLLQCYALVRLSFFSGVDATLARGLSISCVVLASFAVCGVIGMLGGVARKLSGAASIAAVVMLIGPTVTIFGNAGEVLSDTRPVRPELEAMIEAAAASEGVARPTIYHFVLDGYSRADVLRDMYGFDNQPFIDALKRLGFAVAEQAVAPYGQTLLTMNSVFSMNYLNADIAAREGQTAKQVRQAMHGWFVDSPVRRTLEAAGYSIVAIEGSYPPLSLRPATRVIAPPHDWTASTLLGRAVYAMTPLGGPIIHGLFGGRADTRESVRFGLADHSPGPESQPAFYYRHVLAPHPPFDLNRDGSVRETKATGFPDGDHWSPTLAPEDRAQQYREGYLEKLRYANSRIVDLARAIIDRADGPVVIVLHGDHGGGMHLAHDDYATTCAKERFSTFLAVYSDIPAVRESVSEDFNIVNLYRGILSGVFDAEMPPLEDHSYFAPWNDPTGLVEVEPERRGAYEANCKIEGASG